MKGTDSGNRKPTRRNSSGTGPYPRLDYVDNIQELLTSLVETACEHEKDLNLMRLINYIDLYRFYINDTGCAYSRFAGAGQALAPVENIVSFESFVSSSSLLTRAAASASKYYEDEVAAPAPLMLSANDSSR